MQLGDLYKEAKGRLDQAGIDRPEREARIMLRRAGFDEAALIASPGTDISLETATAIMNLVERRAMHEPISRIFGTRQFWGRDFALSPDVLDPRPDSETLIEAALKGPAPGRILDLGTGSGCLLVTLLLEWPQARGTGIDLSQAALDIAAGNAARLGAVKVEWFIGSWYTPLPAGSQFDLIISNPPYIRSADIATLSLEVKYFDPILALDGGIDGLEAYRFVFSQLNEHLSPSGRLLLEVGEGQAEDVMRLSEKAGFSQVKTYMDIAGIARVVEAGRG